ncbi:hypothetical protein BaRGS_00016420 [Batillaria attramentaria]|uniref:Uncharacterized protein n=1 Tax=Batillaria attramentaria TaxID=370345 RepID=A0ABD0KYF5_9CAEN
MMNQYLRSGHITVLASFCDTGGSKARAADTVGRVLCCIRMTTRPPWVNRASTNCSSVGEVSRTRTKTILRVYANSLHNSIPGPQPNNPTAAVDSTPFAFWSKDPSQIMFLF